MLKNEYPINYAQCVEPGNTIVNDTIKLSVLGYLDTLILLLTVTALRTTHIDTREELVLFNGK